MVSRISLNPYKILRELWRFTINVDAAPTIEPVFVIIQRPCKINRSALRSYQTLLISRTNHSLTLDQFFISFNRTFYKPRTNNALHMECFIKSVQLLWIIYSNNRAVCALPHFYSSCILLFLHYDIDPRSTHFLYCLVEFISWPIKCFNWRFNIQNGKCDPSRMLDCFMCCNISKLRYLKNIRIVTFLLKYCYCLLSCFITIFYYLFHENIVIIIFHLSVCRIK